MMLLKFGYNISYFKGRKMSVYAQEGGNIGIDLGS